MEKKYFAAANTKNGFVSRFDEIFSCAKLERIYIIKGGSGTGKSTLMRNIAKEAEARGCEVEYFYCSSDPDSLDGIIITSAQCRGIGVLDGTAPHTRDPKLPGACDEIINLGDFWDTGKLEAAREEIADLTHEKSMRFAEAYEFLYTCGELESLLRADVARAINVPKLTAAADRFLTQAMGAVHLKRTRECPEMKTRAIGAITTKGIVSFDTYRWLGSYAAVVDLMGSAPFMFDALLDSAKRFGLEAYRAPTALDGELTEAVYFPQLDLSIVTADGSEPYETKLINMARFVDRGVFSPSDKHRRKLLKKCASELMDGALERLSRVRELHACLESIYIGAMDFTALDSHREKLIDTILSRL